MGSSNDVLVWVDCEMTGLNLEHDMLIEVAALVTDCELNIIGEGIDVIIRPTDDALAQMSDFVRQMHTTSGLLDELAGGMPMDQAEQAILEHLRQYVPQAGKAPLAGNTIGTDRMFLAKDMPELESFVHYRNIDVSSIKELARRWYPRTYFQAPAKGGNHRALADIQESIEELRYYRQTVFVPQPGLSSDEAKQVAQQHQGSITGAGR